MAYWNVEVSSYVQVKDVPYCMRKNLLRRIVESQVDIIRGRFSHCSASIETDGALDLPRIPT